MDTQKINQLVAEKIMGLQSQVDFGSWTTHDWYLDEDGDIDTFAMEYGNHNGPMCKRCSYSYCHHCQDEPDEPCEIDVPNYTKSISTAWGIVEKLKNDYIVEIIIEDNLTTCKLQEKNSGTVLFAKAETVPLAICLAAIEIKRYLK